MSSGVDVRVQIASIIDVLAKAAVAEIAKVVEDGMVVLRLEMCQRDSEIQKLRSNVEFLHGELRATRERGTRRPQTRDTADDRNIGENHNQPPAADDQNSTPIIEVKVKCEAGEKDGGGPSHYEREVAAWRPATQGETGHRNLENPTFGTNPQPRLHDTSLDARLVEGGGGGGGLLHHGAVGRGPPGFGLHRNAYGVARRRAAKRLMFKKGFLCPYCGKYFERSSHLERHKRIHTGEKPYRCEICGRCFNQNCSLKEHMKIHRRNIQPRLVEIQVTEQKRTPEENPTSTITTTTPIITATTSVRPSEGEIHAAADHLHPTKENPSPTAVHVKAEPVEENITQPHNLAENLAGSAPDGQQWTSGSSAGQADEKTSSAHILMSFPLITQLLSTQNEVFCSGFSCPGKACGELEEQNPPRTPEENPTTPVTITNITNGNGVLHSEGEVHRQLLPKAESGSPSALHVKAEPVEENVTRPPFVGEKPGGESNGSFNGFEADSQQWTSGSAGQTDAMLSSAQTLMSFPGIAQLLSPQIEAFCSGFSFSGKPYGQVENGAAPKPPHGVIPGSGGGGGFVSISGVPTEGEPPNQYRQRRRRVFLNVVRPKKRFACSYCGKEFERGGHLERHLRIHTGEKPYGCHICGRCFNQKSSLKGHMRTHRNVESPDLPTTPHSMYAMPDDQPKESHPRPAPVDEHLMGSVYGKTGSGGAGASDQSICVFLNDANYHLAPAVGQDSEWRDYAPPVKEPPFLENKVKMEILNADQYSLMGLEASGADMQHTPELRGQHVTSHTAAGENRAGSCGPREATGFELSMSASGNPEGGGSGGNETPSRPNCFICSVCGQSFDSFDFFQTHQCKNLLEQSFSCHLCGETFDEMSVLKSHLKLHLE